MLVVRLSRLNANVLDVECSSLVLIWILRFKARMLFASCRFWKVKVFLELNSVVAVVRRCWRRQIVLIDCCKIADRSYGTKSELNNFWWSEKASSTSSILQPSRDAQVCVWVGICLGAVNVCHLASCGADSCCLLMSTFCIIYGAMNAWECSQLTANGCGA